MNNNENDWERIALYTLDGFMVVVVVWFTFLAVNLIG